MKITDKVYALESTEGAYAYIILGMEIVLIDTGFAWVGKKYLYFNLNGYVQHMGYLWREVQSGK